MKNLEFKVLDSIGKIEKSEWDSIFVDIAEGYGFFKTIEESNLKDFSLYYALIYEFGNIQLIAPLFIADFNLDIAVEGFILKLIRIIQKFIPRFMVMKTLFFGSPFGETGIIGIRPGVQNEKYLIDELTKIIKIICKKEKINFVIFKDFLKGDLSTLSRLKEKGFFIVESFPSVVAELSFNSLDDYLKSLSQNTRKDLRRKLKKTESAGNIEVKIVDNVANVINDVYALYLNTYNVATVKFEKLSKEFFLNISYNLNQQTKFFLYYLNGKLAAFNLCFVYKDTLIDKFIGFDYELAYKYNLYFYSWCYNIEWCLKNSMRYYQVGQTDYYPKIKLGGRLIPLYAYIRHNNPVMNRLLRLLAGFLKPASFDENIKSNA